ncbi:SurA N-terminal domain-containing protein [Pseudooceanicola nanhaiensis]|uniref:SurA N-terminal domain-containing protein n=1 Tax=Pseudooceanicola nanhaiensis TaxID=375761 RepID=UPI001CD36FD8|nr:SurA N-terminal domain-containing protein [Pseudooceanicola nanhaiensis]MCA0919999.1 SurA N-terminal domain-containing protein [Pseudooceanicola nanhaiensis]
MATKKSNVAMWVVMGLLILGLGGFGATSISTGPRSVGSVGGNEITVNEYARALQSELRAIQSQTGQALSFEQAEQFGLTEGVLQKLIADKALDNEAARLGVSVGDETLRDQLVTIQAFQGLDGNFDRDAYRFALQQSGLSESEFEKSLRDDTTRTILQAAVATGVKMPATYVDTILDFVAARRNVTFARLTEGDITTGLPVPSDEDLKAFYDAHIDQYTAPEKKRITYAWLTPEDLVDTVEIDDDLIRQQYEARADEFNRPERRLVERLVFLDEATAQTALDSVTSGETDFDGLVADRGLTLSDVDMGDVTEDTLGAAGAAVFAATSGDVVGPVETDLGPALFRVNGVLPAQETPLDSARLIIREDLAMDRARRQAEGEAEPAEDLLAGGATLEELVEETPLTLGTIDWSDGIGEGIAAYGGFDAFAAELTADDYPEIHVLEDGTIFAMRLDETLPPAPEPFEDVKPRLTGAWEAEQTVKILTERAEGAIGRMQEGATFEAAGLTPQTQEGLMRSDTILGMPASITEAIFAMEPGDVITRAAFGSVIVIRLDDILPPDEDAPQVAQTRQQLASQTDGSLAQDLYSAYAADLRDRAGIKINRTAIDAVHAQFR